jgi:hypothetical protein
VTEERITAMRAFLEAFNRHDVDAIMSLISQLRSRELGLPETSRGRAGARKIADWLTLDVEQPFGGGSARP